MAQMQRRQPAYFVEVKELLKGAFTKNQGWDPNFVTTSFGMKVSRTTVIGTVVEIDEQSISVDDSTGIISARVFDDNALFEGLKSGDVVMVIGKVRQYGEQNYITPEIVRKLDAAWVQYRKKNVELIKKLYAESKIKQEELQASAEDFSNGAEVVQEIVESSVEETTNQKTSILEKVMKYIDDEDKGSGVEKVKVLDKFDDEDVIDALDSLIMEGDIFEVKPGVFKVLK